MKKAVRFVLRLFFKSIWLLIVVLILPIAIPFLAIVSLIEWASDESAFWKCYREMIFQLFENPLL